MSDTDTMDDITRRIAVLNESLRLFIDAWRNRAGSASFDSTRERIDDLCKVIISLGGTITEPTP